MRKKKDRGHVAGAESPALRTLDGHDEKAVARLAALVGKLPMRTLETPVLAALIRGARAMRQASCDLIARESGINGQTVARVEKEACPSDATRLRLFETFWRAGFDFDYDPAKGRLTISADLEAVLPAVLEDRRSGRPADASKAAA